MSESGSIQQPGAIEATEQNENGFAGSRWLAWLSRLAVCLVWPLIWVGGLVTTYDAGMAVPDWPNTYGYNLFLYPYSTWLVGPFDLFIEHGHRLLGAVVGFVAIGIFVAALVSSSRRWVKWMAGLLLLMVIAQGGLGGARVVLGDRTLAMIHGCFGPAFFAFCVAFAVCTGRFWKRPLQRSGTAPGSGLLTLSVVLVGLAYLQLILGAMLRHVQPITTPGSFTMTVAMHVMTAFVLWALVGLAYWRFRRTGDESLSRPAGWLIPLVGLQILLGVGTWVANYGYPDLLSFIPGSEAFVVRAKGYADSMVVTSHVATGSLILAVATMLTVRTLRRRWLVRHSQTVRAQPAAVLSTDKGAGRNAAGGGQTDTFGLQHARS